MLYDLNNDPKQNVDISGDTNNAALVKNYREKLLVMRKKVNKNPV